DGNGFLFVTDRTAGELDVVDPHANQIVGSTALASQSDYVRFAAATNELWVSEPSSSRLEIFSLSNAIGLERDLRASRARHPGVQLGFLGGRDALHVLLEIGFRGAMSF